MAVLAIDIGGTKLAAGIVNTEGRILARGEVPTLAVEGLEPVLGRIVGLGRDLLSRPEAAERVHPSSRRGLRGAGGPQGWDRLQSTKLARMDPRPPDGPSPTRARPSGCSRKRRQRGRARRTPLRRRSGRAEHRVHNRQHGDRRWNHPRRQDVARIERRRGRDRPHDGLLRTGPCAGAGIGDAWRPCPPVRPSRVGPGRWWPPADNPHSAKLRA